MVLDRAGEFDAPASKVGDGTLDVIAVERDVVSPGVGGILDGWTPRSPSGKSKIHQSSPTSLPGSFTVSLKNLRVASGSVE